MPELSVDLIIAVPADQVWNVIGPGFDRIGEWATAIPASTAVPTHRSEPGLPEPPGVPPALDAPVAGRICQTGIRLVPRITETLTAYDDARRSLTYVASGMPGFVTQARNTWTVIALAPDRCLVRLQARFDTRGLLGLLGRWAVLAQTRRTSRHLADDLRHYAETGTPSPRKQRQQRAAATAAPRSPNPPAGG
jgi:hypothetical protein